MDGRDELDGADEGNLGGPRRVVRFGSGRIVDPDDEGRFALFVAIWDVGFFVQDVTAEGCSFGGKVATDAQCQVDRVDGDLDKDVERLERRLRDGNCRRRLSSRPERRTGRLTETTMSIMHNHLGAHLFRREIIDTARAIRHIRQQQRCHIHSFVFAALYALGSRVRIVFEDISNDGSVDHEAFGHLEGYRADPVAPELMDGFVDLEAVIGGQAWNR